jgi:transcription elongation factor Elf1
MNEWNPIQPNQGVVSGITNEPRVIQTDAGAKDGQNKCPKCGATDISLNPNNGLLRCNFCRHEFAPEKVAGMETDISNLQGVVIGSGAQDIIADTNDVLTFKCSSCGAEVVIDTSEATQARCHWCRNTLSVNQQIPNGAIPDIVLPFSVTKRAAQAEIEKFVGKRKLFANKKFTEEFCTENIMGVYLPYMTVDINASAKLSGQGERQVRRYTRGSDKNARTYYDADLYDVERDFDITVQGLTVESSSDKLQKSSDKTNNVINAIMPFDIENSAKWNANYLKGYNSEKRDTNIDQLKNLVDTQARDISRHNANETLKEYDRGVRWSDEQFNVKGKQWKSAYFPVWLYSYQQVMSGGRNLLHYVAVNARTKQTMGSVPLNIPKLLMVSAIVQILGLLAAFFIDWDYSGLFALAGVICFLIFYLKYRNVTARSKYEEHTKAVLSNIRKSDIFVRSLKELSSPTMAGANNQRISSHGTGAQLMEAFTENNSVANMIKKHIDK